MAGKASGCMIVIHYHGSLGFVQDLRAFFAHIFPQRPIVVAEAELDYRDWNPIGVFTVWIHSHAVLSDRQNFPIPFDVEEARLEIANALLETPAEALHMRSVVRKHEALDLKLVVVTSGEITMLIL